MEAGAQEGDEVGGTALPLIDLELIAEPIHDKAEVVALQAEEV